MTCVNTLKANQNVNYQLSFKEKSKKYPDKDVEENRRNSGTAGRP